uniref:Uncharacterized protein n=1 Tax=Oryza nivara TaxID=4536 RepID=A0A0E0HWI7_ORYNI
MFPRKTSDSTCILYIMLYYSYMFGDGNPKVGGERVPLVRVGPALCDTAGGSADKPYEVPCSGRQGWELGQGEKSLYKE